MSNRFFYSLLLLLAPALRAQTPASSPPQDVVELDRLVVTTATRTERTLLEVPVRTEVVLREDIELRVTVNFSQAVELLNGVRVESDCQNCNTSQVQLLGLGGAYNQILFDGTPLLSTLGGVYGLEQIPAAFVDRLEIVKGGGSALYGPGAVGGVINLVPVEPRVFGGFLQGGVEVQKGDPLYFADGRLNVVSAGGRLGLSVVAQGGRNDAIDYDGDGYSEITEKDLRVAGFQAWFAPTGNAKLRANYQYTWEDRRGGNRFDQPEYLANIAEALQTRYHRGGLVWDQVVTPDFDFRIGYAFAYIERGSFYGGLGDVVTDPRDPDYDPSQLDPSVPGGAAEVSYNQYGFTENPLHYWDSQFNYRLGSHALAFGAQYRRESVRDDNRDFAGTTLRTTVDDSFSNTGVYVQDEWSVNPALDLVIGGRVDQSSKLDDPVISPRLVAAVQASDLLKIRAGVSTGFRAPEVFSEDLHVDTLGAEPVRLRNAAGLSEERAVTVMAGFDWRSDLAASRWAFDATASMTRIKDTFLISEIQTDSDGTLFQERSNAAGSEVAGVEANLAFTPLSVLRLTAGLAYYRSRYDEAEVVFDDTADGGSTVIASRDYLKTPNWSGVAQAVWTPNPAFDVFLGLKYTGRLMALNNNTGALNRTSDFWVVDLGATRHFRIGGRHLDLSFGVKNLFDERQPDLERGALRDSDYVYGPRFARSVYASLKYAF